jgi:hypothetical protein
MMRQLVAEKLAEAIGGCRPMMHINVLTRWAANFLVLDSIQKSRIALQFAAAADCSDSLPTGSKAATVCQYLLSPRFWKHVDTLKERLQPFRMRSTCSRATSHTWLNVTQCWLFCATKSRAGPSSTVKKGYSEMLGARSLKELWQQWTVCHKWCLEAPWPRHTFSHAPLHLQLTSSVPQLRKQAMACFSVYLPLQIPHECCTGCN